VDPEKVKQEVYGAFLNYVKHAIDVLNRRPTLKERMVDESVKLAYIDPSFRLRSLVATLEASPDFKNLSSIIDKAFTTSKRSTLKKLPTRSVYSLTFPYFFKRSHFYTETYRGKPVNPEDLFELFWSAFFRRTVRTTRFRLLDRAWLGLHLEC
jgi:hypothetical protein